MNHVREKLKTLMKQCASYRDSNLLKIISYILMVVFFGFSCWLFYFTFLSNDPRSLLIEVQTAQFKITLFNDVLFPIENDYLVKLDGGKPLRFKDSPDGMIEESGRIEESGMITIHKGSTVRVRRMGYGKISLIMKRGTTPVIPNHLNTEKPNAVAKPVDVIDKKILISYNKQGSNNQDKEDTDLEEAIANEVEIIIDNLEDRKGSPLVFSFIGLIADIPNIEELQGNIPPIIYSGILHLVNNTFIGGDFYEVGPFEIHTGDGLEFALSEERPFNGFFTYSKDNPGLLLVANAQFSGRVGITRFRHVPLYIQASPWQKLANDEILLLFWSIMTFLLTIIFKFRS